MTSFTDILSTPFSEIRPPEPLPEGQYLALIDGQPEVTQRGARNTQCVIFPIKLIQAVSQDETFQRDLADALGHKTLGDLRLSHTMWVTEASAYRLKQFLVDHLLIEGTTNALQAISMANGRQFLATAGPSIGKDGNVRTEIKSTARA